jgi:membrane protease YdiL (CAAX protease family)
MIGILVAIAISWALLFLIEKKSLLALGFLPIIKKLSQFLVGLIITAILCVLVQYFESYLKSSEWILNENISGIIVLESFFWDVKSVLTEELIFRGALLYIIIKKLGSTKAILISAFAFGAYHWFSFGVLGNVMAMIFVLIGTGLMGYAWAYAFSKTKSMMLPFGLHLGWNFVNNAIFSKGPLGELVLVSQGGTELADWNWILNFVSSSVLVPILLIIYVRYFVKTETELKI